MSFLGLEGFGVALGRAAFHPAQARQSAEHLRIEPVLRALRSEMSEEKLDLAIHHTCLKRHIDIRLADITVPLGNFVLEDQVIAERIRCEAVELAVILMCVVRRWVNMTSGSVRALRSDIHSLI